VTDEVIKYIY